MNESMTSFHPYSQFMLGPLDIKQKDWLDNGSRFRFTVTLGDSFPFSLHKSVVKGAEVLKITLMSLHFVREIQENYTNE